MNEQFELTLNHYTFQTKPTADEVKEKIRPFKHNTIVQADIYRLAEWIEAGHPFHASVLDESLNTATSSYQPNQLSAYVNRTCFIPNRTRLISIDVDHGNMSLSELKTCIASVPHGLIYKTMSYSETKKKYRVLFIADRCFKDESEFNLVQTSLIYLFAHPFKDRLQQLIEQDDKVDFSVKDPARISFAGRVIESEIYDRTFNLDRFIQQCRQLDVLTLKESFVADYRQLKRQQSKSVAGTRQNALPRPKKAKKETTSVRDHVLDIVCEGLQRYASTHDLKTARTDYLDTIEFINQIPLTELLQEDVYTMFCCYLPDHEDQNPSANIILDDHQKTRYYCFSCEDGHSLSTFDFIETILLYYQPALSRYQVIQTVFDLLGVKIYSDYQEHVSQLLRENRRFLRDWNYNDSLHKRLQKENVLSLLKEMTELAEFKSPYKPLTFNRTGDYACFFMSNRHLNAEMRRLGYKGHSDVSKTNKKINRLVKLGLIEKISDEDLDPDFLAESHRYREILRQQEIRQEGASKTSYARRMDFYIIPMISRSLLETAEEMITFEAKHHVLSRHQSMKQTLTVHGKEKAESVYVQSEIALTRKDETFLKHLHAAAQRLIELQGYFTVKQLCRAVDPKGNLVKAKQEVDAYGVVKTTPAKVVRENKVKLFLPSVKLDQSLESCTINKDLRDRYQIPASVKKGTRIYFLNH